jgi:hypothetical protein
MQNAFIIAAVEEYHQQRIRKALQQMPAYDRQKVYRQGEYVVAIFPAESTNCSFNTEVFF